MNASKARKIKTGYVTYFMGASNYEGVETRRMLDAPVSMDFTKSIGANNAAWLNLRGNTRPEIRDNIQVQRVELPEKRVYRYFVSINIPLLPINLKWYVLDFDIVTIDATRYPDDMINSQLNCLADLAAKEAKLPILAALMRGYGNSNLYYIACNRERYMLYSVNKYLR